MEPIAPIHHTIELVVYEATTSIPQQIAEKCCKYTGVSVDRARVILRRRVTNLNELPGISRFAKFLSDSLQ